MIFPVLGDRYYASVSFLLPMTGADGSTTFTDLSSSPKVITRYGDTKISTAQSKWGQGSMYLDGVGDYLSIADSTAMELGSGDFTIECWVQLTAYSASYSGSYTSTIIGKYTSGSTAFILGVRGTVSSWTLLLFNANGTEFTSAWSPVNDTWYHVAVCRSGNTLRFFVDGVQLGADKTLSVGITNVSTPTTIGRIAFSGYEYYLTGYLQDLRVTKAVARYTTNFPLSGGPLPIRLPEMPVNKAFQQFSFNNTARLGI